MEKLKQIENLIEKFRQGLLSPGEVKELYGLTKEKSENEALEELLKQVWEKSDMDEMDIPSGKILGNLRKNIGIDLNKNNLSPRKPKILRLNTYLKYAAIILLVIGISWITKNIFDWRNDDSKMFGDNSTEVSVSLGEKTKITLPDGSIVHLNSGSKLHYPKQFNEQSRDVYLEGEAFFDVKKDTRRPVLCKNF
ncbi:MAG: FecR domain-containing protein [Chloroflexia bacterium]|nr:FecR domain-containing protein [Chloroflexia bacterium]